MEIAIGIELILNAKYVNMSDYRNRFRDIHFNLSKNKKLLHDLLQKDLSVQQLCEMSNEELADEKIICITTKK